jgi:hypothetical protein
MKMSAALKVKVEKQLGCNAIPEEHGAAPKLQQAFGDHTFFLDKNGLHIVEPDPSTSNQSGKVVKLAKWANQERDALQGQEPEVLSVTVDLKDPEPGNPDAA